MILGTNGIARRVPLGPIPRSSHRPESAKNAPAPRWPPPSHGFVSFDHGVTGEASEAVPPADPSKQRLGLYHPFQDPCSTASTCHGPSVRSFVVVSSEFRRMNGRLLGGQARRRYSRQERKPGPRNGSLWMNQTSLRLSPLPPKSNRVNHGGATLPSCPPSSPTAAATRRWL